MEQLTFGGYYEQNKDGDRTHARVYGVRLTMEQKENINTIQFMMKVRCHKNANAYLWEATLEKYAIQINQQQPKGLKAGYDQVFGTQVLYPVTLMVAPNGTIHTISDTSYIEIQERFVEFKKAILQEATGDQITQYLDTLSQGIATKKKLLHYLQSDWFWAIYFQKIYLSEDTISLSMPVDTVLGKEIYDGKLTFKTSLSYYQTRQHVFTGTVSPSFLSQHPGMPYKNVTIDITYDFEKDTGIFTHATAIQHRIDHSQEDSKTTIDIYHLSEKDEEANSNLHTQDRKPGILQQIQQIVQWWL